MSARLPVARRFGRRTPALAREHALAWLLALVVLLPVGLHEPALIARMTGLLPLVALAGAVAWSWRRAGVLSIGHAAYFGIGALLASAATGAGTSAGASTGGPGGAAADPAGGWAGLWAGIGSGIDALSSGPATIDGWIGGLATVAHAVARPALALPVAMLAGAALAVPLSWLLVRPVAHDAAGRDALRTVLLTGAVAAGMAVLAARFADRLAAALTAAFAGSGTAVAGGSLAAPLLQPLAAAAAPLAAAVDGQGVVDGQGAAALARYALVAGIVLAGTVAMFRHRASPAGLRLAAASMAPERARASGIAVLAVRRRAYVGSALVAVGCGWLAGIASPQAGAAMPGAALGIEALVWVVVGGRGSEICAMLGALVWLGLGTIAGHAPSEPVLPAVMPTAAMQWPGLGWPLAAALIAFGAVAVVPGGAGWFGWIVERAAGARAARPS